MVNKYPTKIGITSNYIKRDLEDVLEKYLATPQIIAIVGPRRSGKTTLLLRFKEKLPQSVFLSFEDENILTLFEKDFKSFIKLYIEPNQAIILDEFQYSQRGGKNLKYLFDFYPGKKIIISGSSSIELTIKAVKYLVGRILTFPLYPFSFQEFLRAKNFQLGKLVSDEKIISTALFKQTEPYLNEYLIYGGYPEIVLSDDLSVKQTLLQNIYQLYFLKDVKTLTQFTNDWKLKNLVKILAVNLGGIVNYVQLASEAKIDFKTLKSYLNFLEKTFIIFPVPPFYTNKSKELIKNPKFYFLDLGLRNALANSFEPLVFRRDVGYLYENMMAANLLAENLSPRFWRTKGKAEVDFIISDSGKTIPIEIKSHLRQPKISRSLSSFLGQYQSEKAYMVNSNIFGKKKIGKTEINFVPVFTRFRKIFTKRQRPSAIISKRP